jgi:hypothetical protein
MSQRINTHHVAVGILQTRILLAIGELEQRKKIHLVSLYIYKVARGERIHQIQLIANYFN